MARDHILEVNLTLTLLSQPAISSFQIWSSVGTRNPTPLTGRLTTIAELAYALGAPGMIRPRAEVVLYDQVGDRLTSVPVRPVHAAIIPVFLGAHPWTRFPQHLHPTTQAEERAAASHAAELELE